MFVRTNNPSAMSSGKEEVTVIDHFLRRKTRRILLKRNDVFEGRFVLRDKTRLAWHGSRRLAVVSLNAGEIYVSGDEFRENGWPRGKNVDFSPRIYPSGRWMLQNEKGKDVYSRSQNIFIYRDIIPLFRDKWRPISVKNRFLRTCLFFSNVRNWRSRDYSIG